MQVSGLIINDYSHHHSHWNSARSLSQWLTQNQVPALYGIDTRLLTKKIREKGSLKARIELEPAFFSPEVRASLASRAYPTRHPSLSDRPQPGPRPPRQTAEPPAFVDPNERNLAAEVSVKAPRTYGEGNKFKVLAVDCGIKANIIRSIVQRDCELTLVPWDTPLLPLMDKYDGLFLSNGPGDPSVMQAAQCPALHPPAPAARTPAPDLPSPPRSPHSAPPPPPLLTPTPGAACR